MDIVEILMYIFLRKFKINKWIGIDVGLGTI